MTAKVRALLRDRRRLVYLLLIAALCAAVFLYAVHCARTCSADRSPDEAAYIAMARRLLTERVYSFWGEGPDAYVTPGFPLLLALGMAVFGSGAKGILAVKVAQCAMLAGIIALTARLARRVSGRCLAGLIAGVLVAGDLSLFYFATHLLTEVPYIFFLLLFLTILYEAQRHDRLWLHAAAGAAFAWAVLIRPMVFVTLPFWYLVPLLRAKGKRRAVLRQAGAFGLGMLALFAPWWGRNLIVLHRFVLFGTQTNPIFSGIAENMWQYGVDDPHSLRGNLALLLEFIRKWPGMTLRWLTFGKFQIIFMNIFQPYRGPIITAFFQHLAVYTGLCGGLCALASRRLRGPAIAFWVYFAASFLFVPEPRFAMQYIPLLAILSGWLISAATVQIRREDGEAR